MSLDKTKLTLKRLLQRHGNYIKNVPKDIKPDYSERGLGSGYSYKGYDDKDRDFIYYKVRELDDIFNGADSIIKFDVDNVFITEKRAIEELFSTKEYIDEVLTELKEIEKRNQGREYSQYPIKICHGIFKEVAEILEEVISSEEIVNFLNPTGLKTLQNENIKLKFDVFWQKKIFRGILHLLAFIPFFVGCLYVISSKDDDDITGAKKTLVITIAGIMTILFNIFFNNHSSFKDSYKLILPKSRKNLQEKEWRIFSKQQ
jgi:hypothetical protein